MKKRLKKCRACQSNKHSLCDGLSATKDGRPCPCCGGASLEDKKNKEEAIINSQFERDYSSYAVSWDGFIRVQKRQTGLNNRELISCLPKSIQEEKLLAQELQMPIEWLRRFISEHRDDFSTPFIDSNGHKVDI